MSPKPITRRGTMKPLTLSHPGLTRDALLSLAEVIPGAWVGIRIAAFLLMLTGWKSTQLAELFGLSRWGAVKLIQKGNREGLDAIVDHPRPGRPSQICSTTIIYSGQRQLKFPASVNYFSRPTTIRPRSFLPR